MDTQTNLRWASLAALVQQANPQPLSLRTIMILVYLLQTVRKVPLNYNFRFYGYGPHNEDVLSDLNLMNIRGIVQYKLAKLSGGAYYEVTVGDKIDNAMASLASYKDDVAAVVNDFGQRSLTDLEMIGTIVGRHQEYPQESIMTTAHKVRLVQPNYWGVDKVTQEITCLKEIGYLKDSSKKTAIERLRYLVYGPSQGETAVVHIADLRAFFEEHERLRATIECGIA
jgi:uncharacterized protein YwgA